MLALHTYPPSRPHALAARSTGGAVQVCDEVDWRAGATRVLAHALGEGWRPDRGGTAGSRHAPKLSGTAHTSATARIASRTVTPDAGRSDHYPVYASIPLPAT